MVARRIEESIDNQGIKRERGENPRQYPLL